MMQIGKLTLGKPFLWPVERFIGYVVIIFAIVDLGMVLLRDIGFDWLSYSRLFAVGGLTIAAGLFYRSSGRSERISIALIATGMLVLFTIVLSVFNYLLLPLWRDPIDPFLVKIDALFGYSWPGIVEFSGRHPWFNELTRYAYVSTLGQMALLVIILGFGGKQKELHMFLLSIIVSGMVTIGFWALFPAFGTSVLYDISGTIEQAAKPVVGSAYGAELLRLGAEGPQFITPKDIEGLVAFPSYHTIIAVLAVYAARTNRLLFPIIFMINLFVLPGVLIHGGHHLIDVFGGLLTAYGTICVSRYVVVRKGIQPVETSIFTEDEASFAHSRSEMSGLNR